MCGLTLNLEELSRWRNDNGDSTHNLQYPFKSDSVIMDLGGFKGIWAQQMIDLYNPNVYIIEPVNQFYSHMVDKFTDNPKVRLMNVAPVHPKKSLKTGLLAAVLVFPVTPATVTIVPSPKTISSPTEKLRTTVGAVERERPEAPRTAAALNVYPLEIPDPLVTTTFKEFPRTPGYLPKNAAPDTPVVALSKAVVFRICILLTVAPVNAIETFEL